MALRRRLGRGLLRAAALDFSVGGGTMCYGGTRPALPADLAALGSLFAAPSDSEAARVCLGLLLLARKELDAAHDIVGELESAEALYAHALIHRREGSAEGEAGLPGYSNARCECPARSHHARSH